MMRKCLPIALIVPMWQGKALGTTDECLLFVFSVTGCQGNAESPKNKNVSTLCLVSSGVMETPQGRCGWLGLKHQLTSGTRENCRIVSLSFFLSLSSSFSFSFFVFFVLGLFKSFPAVHAAVHFVKFRFASQLYQTKHLITCLCYVPTAPDSSSDDPRRLPGRYLKSQNNHSAFWPFFGGVIL